MLGIFQDYIRSFKEMMQFETKSNTPETHARSLIVLSSVYFVLNNFYAM